MADEIDDANWSAHELNIFCVYVLIMDYVNVKSFACAPTLSLQHIIKHFFSS